MTKGGEGLFSRCSVRLFVSSFRWSGHVVLAVKLKQLSVFPRALLRTNQGIPASTCANHIRASGFSRTLTAELAGRCALRPRLGGPWSRGATLLSRRSEVIRPGKLAEACPAQNRRSKLLPQQLWASYFEGVRERRLKLWAPFPHILVCAFDAKLHRGTIHPNSLLSA